MMKFNAFLKNTTYSVLISMLLPITSSFAIEFNSYIYEMPATEDFISKQVYNNTKNNNLYRISIQKIEKPSAKTELELPIESGELMYAPQKLMIQQGERNFFKIFYQGPRDQQERYYRINFLETPLSLYAPETEHKSPLVFSNLSVSTILIVRPRELKLAYTVDEKTGIIQNTGNTFFKVIIHQGCDGSEEQAKQFYMLPGEFYQHASIQQNNRKYILAMKQYRPLGQACFSKAPSPAQTPPPSP